MGQSHEEVKQFLEALQVEGFHGEVIDEEVAVEDDGENQLTINVAISASQKCTQLGLFLAA